jgi:hypothetical protein
VRAISPFDSISERLGHYFAGHIKLRMGAV